MAGIGFGGFESALAEKYRILAQHADADSMRAAAQANESAANAATLGPLAQARINQMAAQSRLGQDQLYQQGKLLPGEIAGQRIKNMGGMLDNEFLRRRIPFGMNQSGEMTYTPLGPELQGDASAVDAAPAPEPRYSGPLQIGTGFDAPQPKPPTSLGMPKKPTVNIGDVPLGWPSLGLTQSNAPKPTFNSLTPLSSPPADTRSDFFKSQGIGMQPKKPSGSALYDKLGYGGM